MQVDAVGNFRKSPVFSGVYFVNKNKLVQSGKNVVKNILDNEVVKQYTKRLDYDLLIRQTDGLTEWKMISVNEPKSIKLPWVPILDENSLTKSSLSGYINKFFLSVKSSNKVGDYIASSSQDAKLVKDMELLENASNYHKEMVERVDWLD